MLEGSFDKLVHGHIRLSLCEFGSSVCLEDVWKLVV